MQEWIIAMLAISVLLILRDMAKTFLTGKIRGFREAAVTEEETLPRTEKGEKYAACFQKLSESFYGLPYRKECLSETQVEQILGSVCEQVCGNCYQREFCWEQQFEHMAEEAQILVRALETGAEEDISFARTRWTGRCARSPLFFQALEEGVRREKETLAWTNRLIENRLAVAGQLMETAAILRKVAEEAVEPATVENEFQTELRRSLRKRHVVLKKAWTLEPEEGKRRFFLSLRTRGGQCVSVGEVARILSEACGSLMAPVPGGRCIVNGEYHTVSFVEDAGYQVLYGTARMTREGEKVSGDNYVCFQDENRFVLCLSDGMGFGRAAGQESGTVVELVEQFLEAGFSPETAARMVNSTLILKEQEILFSTMDLCAVDLYTGLCSFLKAGAATTFIRRDHWVETITSENLALGLVRQTDFEQTARKLYHGDLLILMSDGVLDALPAGREEELLKEILLELPQTTPKEMARGILERVLGYCDFHPRDDMTILTARILRK